MKKNNKIPPIEPVNIKILDVLISAIQSEMDNRKERARRSMEEERLLMHHTVGQLVKTFFLEDAARAEYGKSIIKKISEAVGMSMSELYESIQFYETYPQILWSTRKLTWSHIKPVLTLKKESERQKVIEKIISKNLSVKEVQVLLNKVPKPKKLKTTLTTSTDRGQPYTYKLKDDNGMLYIDLGFGISIFSPDQTLNHKSVIESELYNARFKFTYVETHKSPHYTYKARVKNIIDGDTFEVELELGFRCKYILKIRLKGIDTPELKTKEGGAARQFVVDQLNNCDFIAVKTYWEDKYKRYLADVYYLEGESDLDTVIKKGTFLNAQLNSIHRLTH